MKMTTSISRILAAIGVAFIGLIFFMSGLQSGYYGWGYVIGGILSAMLLFAIAIGLLVAEPPEVIK